MPLKDVTTSNFIGAKVCFLFNLCDWCGGDVRPVVGGLEMRVWVDYIIVFALEFEIAGLCRPDKAVEDFVKDSKD